MNIRDREMETIKKELNGNAEKWENKQTIIRNREFAMPSIPTAQQLLSHCCHPSLCG